MERGELLFGCFFWEKGFWRGSSKASFVRENEGERTEKVGAKSERGSLGEYSFGVEQQTVREKLEAARNVSFWRA